jgi:uncharacterized phage protein gp47/JayE
MAFFSKDPNTILQQSLDFMRANTALTSVGPGSKYRALLEIMKQELGEAYSTFDINQAIGFIYGASDKYLDYIGDMFGMQRFSATRVEISAASKIIKFYVPSGYTFGGINSGNDITIPAGTTIYGYKNDTTIEYYVSEDTVLPKDKNEIYVAAKSAGSGASFNIPSGILIYHKFTDYTETAKGLLLVTNISSIESGLDAESDDNFRYRIINHYLSSQNANEVALRMAVLEVPGVADVRYFNNSQGLGTATIVIKSIVLPMPSDLPDKVLANVEKKASAGIKVIIEKPVEIYFSFDIKITYTRPLSIDERVSLQSGLNAYIGDYINNLDVGESFSINTLANDIISYSPLIKTIGSPGRFFDRIYLYKELLPDKPKIKRDITNGYVTGLNEKPVLANVGDIIAVNYL